MYVTEPETASHAKGPRRASYRPAPLHPLTLRRGPLRPGSASAEHQAGHRAKLSGPAPGNSRKFSS